MPEPGPTARSDAAWLRAARVQLTYLWRHGRLAHLTAPRAFTELVQHRKLYDRDARLPALADKLLVKAMVAEQLGPAWITPTWWSGRSLPAEPTWPRPFVVKARHGCNQTIFVRGDPVDWAHCRRVTARWMAADYGIWLDEWLYRAIPRGLLVEPFLGGGPALPIDYKLYVFGGEVHYIQAHLARETRHRWLLFDPAWRPLTPATDLPPAPRSLPAMIAAARTLAADLEFVRVDFYEVAGAPRFGEMTFYPGSGLDPFDPPELDHAMGALWRAARAQRGGARTTAGSDTVPSYIPSPPEFA